MTAAEARMKTYWNNVSIVAKEDISSAIIHGRNEVVVDKLSFQDMVNLQSLGYEIDQEQSSVDIIKW
jgi:hypothetical protein